MSMRSFERADFSDQNEVLFAVLTACSAIVASRKRKLRELFAVATQTESLPQDAFANPDAPATTAAEWQFLQTSEILQCVSLNLMFFSPSFSHFFFSIIVNKRNVGFEECHASSHN